MVAVVVLGVGIPSDYLVSTQLQLWLFCCWGCGCCWAVKKKVIYEKKKIYDLIVKLDLVCPYLHHLEVAGQN